MKQLELPFEEAVADEMERALLGPPLIELYPVDAVGRVYAEDRAIAHVRSSPFVHVVSGWCRSMSMTTTIVAFDLHVRGARIAHVRLAAPKSVPAGFDLHLQATLTVPVATTLDALL